MSLVATLSSSAHNRSDSTHHPAHFDISTLPREVLLLIFRRLFEDNAKRISCLSPVSLTCRRWRNIIVAENAFWSRLYIVVPSQKAVQLAELYASKSKPNDSSAATSPSCLPPGKSRGLSELRIRILFPPTSVAKAQEVFLAHCTELHRHLRGSIQHTLRRATLQVDGASQLHIDILSSFLTEFRSVMSEEALGGLSLELLLPEIQGFPLQNNFWLGYSGLKALLICAKPPYSSQTPKAPSKPAPPKPILPKRQSLKFTPETLPHLVHERDLEASRMLLQHFSGALGTASASSSSSSGRANTVPFPSLPVTGYSTPAQVDPTEQVEYERRLSIYQTAKHRYDSWTRQQTLDWSDLQAIPKLSYSDTSHGLFPHATGGLLDHLVLEGVWLAESLIFPTKGFPHLASLLLTHVKAARSLYRLLESAPNLRELSLRFMIRDLDDMDLTVPKSNRLRRDSEAVNTMDSSMHGSIGQPVPKRIYKVGDSWITLYKDLPQSLQAKMEAEERMSASRKSDAWKWDEMDSELEDDFGEDSDSIATEDDFFNYPKYLAMPVKVSEAFRADEIYVVESSPLTRAYYADHRYRHKVHIRDLGAMCFESLYKWHELVQMRTEFSESEAFPMEDEWDGYEDQDTFAKEFAEQYARQMRARQSTMPEPVVLHHLRSLELAGAQTPIIWVMDEELDGAHNRYGRPGEPIIVTPQLHKAVLRSSLDLNGQITLSSAIQPLRQALPMLDSLWRDRLAGNLRLPRDWCADSLAAAMRKGQVIPGIQSDDEAWLEEELSEEDFDYYIEHPHKISRRRSEWYRELGWADSGGNLQRAYIEALLDGFGSRIVPSVLLAFTTIAAGLTFLDLSYTTLRSPVFTACIHPLSGLSTLILRGVCELENKALISLPQYCPRLSCLNISSAELLSPAGVAPLVSRFREASGGSSKLCRVVVDDPVDFDWGSRDGNLFRAKAEYTAYRYLDFLGLIPDLLAEYWQDAQASGRPFSKRNMKTTEG